MKSLLDQDNSLGFYFGIGCIMVLHNFLKQKVPTVLEEIDQANSKDKMQLIRKFIGTLKC